MSNYTEEFELFWSKYPPRFHETWRPRAGGGAEHYWKSGKRLAMAIWRKLSDSEKAHAMYSVKFMRKGKYVPDAFRWLRDGRYEDMDMPEEKATMPEEILNTIKLKQVPQADKRSTSDKVNEARRKLNGTNKI